jgi:hypothetical protein
MSLFRRRTASGHINQLPSDIVQRMQRYGRHDYDPQKYPDDPGAIWTETQEPLLDFASSDPSGFLDALAQAVLPDGGWAAFGAAHTSWNLLADDKRQGPSYEALMDASVQFLRDSGVPPMRVAGYDWDHWLQKGGTNQDWLPRKAIPQEGDAPLTQLGPGEVRRVAQMLPEHDSNLIFVRRLDDGRVEALIDARRSDDDPTRSQNSWISNTSQHALYVDLGLALQSPTFWFDPELEPFFPVGRPLI